MGLTKLAIQRPVFILMVMVLILLMGRTAYNSMRVEENPDVSFGTISITTVYPGAGAEEVNNLVSRELEESVSGIANLLEVTSSSQEGVSSVVLNFEVGTNMDAALNEVRSKVDARVGELPREVEKPIIEKFDFSATPVLFLTLRSDTHSNRQLRDLADNVFKDRFAQVKGVASVNVSGGDQREIQVRVKKDALLRYGIGILDVQQAVQQASLNVPAGRVEAGAEEFSVRVLGEFKSPEEIGDTYLIVREQGQDGAERKVKLSDLATIVDANTERRSYSRLNGSDAVVITVQKAKEGNAVEISRAIRKTPGNDGMPIIDSIQDQYKVEFIVTRDASVQIEESLFDLQFALLFGIVLVTAVVYMFLHNLRGTMIVAIAIPICLFGALIVLWALGFTINNMTMLALSLAVGVLVDDAIVIIENIYRHLTHGEEPVEAAINGRMEIGLAAIAITLADVVVFIPIAFMGGIVGQFFKALGIGFAVTVLFSLFVSFTVTPMLASRWYKKGEDWEHPTGRFAKWFEARFDAFRNGYARALTWALNHRWYVFGVGFAALFSVFLIIATSGSATVGEALQNPMFMVMAVGALALGLAVPTITHLRNRHSALVRNAYFIVAMILLSRVIPFPPEMPLVVTLIVAWIVALLPAFVYTVLTHKRTERVSFKPVLSGVVFMGAFILVAIVGQQFGAWKKEAVFKFAFFPPSDGGEVSIAVELPPGSTLGETQKVAERIEKVAMAHPEAEYVQSDIGRRGGGGFSAAGLGTNFATVRVELHDKKAMIDSLAFWKKHEGHLRSVSDTSVAADLLQRIGRVPGAKITVSAASGQGFGRPIQMSFQSNDRDALIATAVAIQEGLNAGAIKGVVSPEISSKPGKPELQAIPDRVRLGDTGMNVAQIGAAMRVLYEGDIQSKFRVLGREYDVRVMMDLDDRNDLNLVNQVPVTFKDGNPIYLTDVAKIVRGQGVDKIDRRNRAQEVQVSADLLPGYAAGTVNVEVEKWMEEQGLIKDGVTYQAQGQANVQNREQGYLFGALGLGVLLVYMLLASLYDNLLYPFIIQLAQPQALVGAILALVITDKTLNIVGMIGIIALVGLVGKNAILLVDYANTLRARGSTRFEALVGSGRTRLRPIMMTTLALIFGMLPVALAIGRGSEFRETIGITIIGGVMLSTLLTLFVIPCSYSIFDDLSESLGGKLRKYTRTKSDVSAYRTHPRSNAPEEREEEPTQL